MSKCGARSAAKERAEKRKETMVRSVHNYFEHQRDVFLQNSKCTCTACRHSKSAAEPVMSLSFKATEMATGIKKKKVYRIFKKSKEARLSRSISLEGRCDAELEEAQRLRAALSSGQSLFLDWWHLARAVSEDPHCVSVEHLECVLETTGFVLQPWNDQLVPIEKRSLVLARARYLDEIETARKESTVVYIDIRWLRGRRLRHDPRPGGRSKLLMFAGSLQADPVFKLELRPSVSDVEDVFISWISHLSLDLPHKSALVFVDIPWLSAPSAQVPSEVTPKTAILHWLSERAVEPGMHATRWELLELVKRHTDCASKSRLQAVVERHGHRVLRVPANVADLNPVTRVWPPIEEALASELLAKRGASAVCEEGLRSAASAWRELVSQLPVVEESYRAFDASMAGLLARLPPNTNPYRDDSLVPRA